MLLSNTAWLLLSTVATSLIGVAYWWIAARQFSPEAVGVGSAVISAMMLAGTFATLGLGTLAMGEVQRSPVSARELMAGTVIVVLVVGAMIGLIGSLTLRFVAPDLVVLSSGAVAALVFSIGTGATAAAMVADQMAVGLLRSGIQFWRNLIMSLAKLAAVMIAAVTASGSTSTPIFGAWTLGIAVSLVYAARRLSSAATEADLSLVGGVRRIFALRTQAIGHYLFNIALQLPALALPVACLAVLSADANAKFYISWMVAVLLFMIPISITNVLYPMTVTRVEELRRASAFTLGLSLGVAALGVVALYFGGRELLGLFGPAYEPAHSALVLLALGAIPMSIKSHYVAVSRIKCHLARRVPVAWFGAMIEIATAAGAGDQWGTLRAFAAGWLVAITVEAMIMLPPLAQDLLRGPKSP